METNFTPNKGDNITVEYHGELMENFFSESTIDSGQGLRTIKYKDDLVMLFFIDKHHKLRLIIQIDNSASGWTSYDISPVQLEVSAFDIYHDEAQNTFKIAYSRISNGSNQLLLSDDINLSDIEPLLFAKLLKWNQVKLNNVSRKIDHISMNQSGLLFSTAYCEQDATYSYFRYGESPQYYTLPENTPKVIQLEVGQFDNEFGTFLLYEMKGERSLIFQSFPDEECGEVMLYRFKPCDELNAFTTVDDKDGNDRLYISGDGIFSFQMNVGEGQPTQSIICESNNGVVFSKIEVSSSGNETSIWTIGKEKSKSGLYYLTNKFYESADKINTAKWTAPLQMQDAISEFSSVKGDAFTNQLFLLGSDENKDTLIHFWQDEETTSWHEHPVVLSDLNEFKTMETFTVNIQFKSDTAMLSFHGEKVSVSAEANLLVYIDGKKVDIGPNRTYETTIEDDYINIVYPTKSIAVSQLYVETDFLPTKATIDPAHKIKEKIKVNFSDKNTLKKTKLSNGNSLISSSVSDNYLDEIVSATNNIIENIDRLEGVQGAPTAQLKVHSNTSDIGNTLGDIFHSFSKGFLDCVEFIAEQVKDGMNFIIKIGNKVFDWVSKAVSDVFHFLEGIWKKIKITFKKLFDWLAFLLNWDDVLHTKQVMKQYFNNTILGLADELGNIRKMTHDYFDEVKNKIEDIKSQIDFKQLNEQNLNELRASNTKNNKIDPRANWMGSKKSHIVNSGTQQQVLSAVPSNSMMELSLVAKKLFNHFEILGQQLTDAFSDVSSKFLDVIHGHMKIGDFLEYFVLTLAQFGLAVAQEIIDLILEVLEEAVRSVEKVLNASIDIPFFSYLYKKISGGNLSVNDLICLLIAVPMTVLYKVGEGKAPFEDIDEKQKFINSGKSIFKITI